MWPKIKKLLVLGLEVSYKKTCTQSLKIDHAKLTKDMEWSSIWLEELRGCKDDSLFAEKLAPKRNDLWK